MKQDTTQATPFKLVYGKTATLPVKIKINTYLAKPITEDNFQETFNVEQYQKSWHIAQQYKAISENTAYCLAIWSDIRKLEHITQQCKHCSKNHSTLLGNMSNLIKHQLCIYSSSVKSRKREFIKYGRQDITLVKNPEIRVEHLIEVSLPEETLAITLRKKLMKLQFRKVMEKTITTESLSIIQKTQPKPSDKHTFRLPSLTTVLSTKLQFICNTDVVNKNVTCIVDISRFFSVWHPDGKIQSGYTSLFSASLHSYLMKSLHYHLPVVMKKRLYDPKYPSVLCIKCDLVEDSDHSFLCVQDDSISEALLLTIRVKWCGMVGCLVLENVIIKSLHETGSAGGLYIILAKEFVLKSWVADAARHFGFQSGGDVIIGLVHNIVGYYRSSIWLSAAKLRFFYEKYSLLPSNGSAVSLVVSLLSVKPAEIICSFSVRLDIHVCFGLHPYLSNLDFGFLSHVSVVDSVGV
ncbi:hypothetical protein G9A89_021490 [Geosiphon pyriformis]|nr:hypothetical protein G9A89_021490 [Geosiphon pyriformis]